MIGLRQTGQKQEDQNLLEFPRNRDFCQESIKISSHVSTILMAIFVYVWYVLVPY